MKNDVTSGTMKMNEPRAKKKSGANGRPKISSHARRELEEKRLVSIVAMIRGGLPGSQPVNMKTIRQRLSVHHGVHVSMKRIQRDINDLKTLYHAPIAFDSGRQSYCLTSDWTMPVLDLGDQDVLPALMGMMLSRQLLPAVMEPKINAMKDTLIAGSRRVEEDTGALLHSIMFTAHPLVRSDREVFLEVLHAWQQSHQLEIQMKDAEEQACRIVEPHAFFFWDGAWYLRAKIVVMVDQEPYAEKPWESIPIHRMSSAHMQNETFARDPDIKRKMAEEKFFDFRTFKGIKLTCSSYYPEAMLRIREREWFPGQVCAMWPGGLVLDVPEAAEPVIVPWILQFGGRVQVQEPPELCTLIREEGRRIVGKDNTSRAAECGK